MKVLLVGSGEHAFQYALVLAALDVDFDGSSTALGDGLMVIRHLFGSTFSGDALVSKAISPYSPFQYVDDAYQYVSENIDLLL